MVGQKVTNSLLLERYSPEGLTQVPFVWEEIEAYMGRVCVWSKQAFSSVLLSSAPRITGRLHHPQT